jgi:hypothetical protein
LLKWQNAAMENNPTPSRKTRRASHQTLASMRGNLRQILAVPEIDRSEAQRKAIIKITGTLNHARHEQMEKGRRVAERIQKLESENLAFDNPAYVRMILRSLAYLASDDGYVRGAALSDMTDENPFMSSGAFDQLADMGYLRRFQDGSLLVEEKGWRMIEQTMRRRTG